MRAAGVRVIKQQVGEALHVGVGGQGEGARSPTLPGTGRAGLQAIACCVFWGRGEEMERSDEVGNGLSR